MIIKLKNKVSQYIIGGSDYNLGFNLDIKLREYLRCRADGYQYSEAFKKGRWDGYNKFINSKCEFQTGFLQIVLEYCEKLGVEVEVKDLRTNPTIISDTFITNVGNNEGWELRDYQQRVVKNTLSKTVGGHPFIRGMWFLEPNSGKTSMMVGLIRNLIDVNTLVIIDRKKNFEQTYEFLSECFEVGRINSKNLDLDNTVTVAMAKTLASLTKKNKEVVTYLKSINLIICDEAHRAASDTYKTILGTSDCYSTILMSGTLLDIESKHKKLILHGLSGKVLDRVTGEDIVDYGVSLKPSVTMYLNEVPNLDTINTFPYREKYEHIVIQSKARLNTIIEEFQRDPTQIMVIAVQYKDHATHLCEQLDNEFKGSIRVDYSHSSDEFKDEKIEDLIDRKINIFVSTSILQESLNIPCITTIVYALGGKSKVAIKQWKGRGSRIDSESTREVIRIIDFWDVGFEEQSRSRIKTYVKEGYDLEIKYKHNRFYSPKLFG